MEYLDGEDIFFDNFSPGVNRFIHYCEKKIERNIVLRWLTPFACLERMISLDNTNLADLITEIELLLLLRSTKRDVFIWTNRAKENLMWSKWHRYVYVILCWFIPKTNIIIVHFHSLFQRRFIFIPYTANVNRNHIMLISFLYY